MTAYDSISATRGHFVYLIVPRAVGTRTYDDCAGSGNCLSFGLTTNYDINDDRDIGDGYYEIDTGTITVTSASATQITGTFSGTAGGFSVTSGTFDVPIRAGAVYDALPPRRVRARGLRGDRPSE